jgi:hypothetical protein
MAGCCENCNDTPVSIYGGELLIEQYFLVTAHGGCVCVFPFACAVSRITPRVSKIFRKGKGGYNI